MMESLAVAASWATPTSLFVLVNVVIGFIAFSSVFNSRKNDTDEPHQPQRQRLVRAPSLFSRVTSFNFCASSNESEIPPLTTPAPSFLSRMSSFNNTSYNHRSGDEDSTDEPYVHRSEESETAPSLLTRISSFNRFSFNKQAESEPESEQAPSLLKRMASIKLALQRSTEPVTESVVVVEEQMTRSTTVPKKKKKLPPRMKKSSSEKSKETASFGEVDAQADDFINRFKQQLRLQRLDSMLRNRNST